MCCDAAFPSVTVIVCRVGDDVYLRELILLEAIMETAAIFHASKRVSPNVFKWRVLMASSSESNLIPPASSTASAQEIYRTKSIATRLTEAEFAEVEGAATKAGKKVSEWLRDVALGHVHAASEEPTDPVLLAEMMGMRSLMVNLFAKASEGPISSEDLRKMSLYADSIKEQKAREFLAQRLRQNGTK